MMIDMRLFALLAVLTLFVGAYLWMRPGAKKLKPSGVGDIGQKRK